MSDAISDEFYSAVCPECGHKNLEARVLCVMCGSRLRPQDVPSLRRSYLLLIARWAASKPGDRDYGRLGPLTVTMLDELLDAARNEKSTCGHAWVDARNEIIVSGEWCRKCGAIRPTQPYDPPRGYRKGGENPNPPSAKPPPPPAPPPSREVEKGM